MAQVTIARRGSVALITVDNPPVHALSTAIRAGLLAAIQSVNQDASLKGAVIMTASRTFIAGADLREMDRPLEEPQLPAVIAAISASGKPIAAALHGSVLGGGMEIALACRIRVAQTGTVLGLPEVKLGLIPGSGGTQRLLRLVDFDRAARMITSGKPIQAEEALRLGLVHHVSDDAAGTAVDLIENDAESFASTPEIEARPANCPDPSGIEALREDVRKAARGQAAPLAVLALMESTAELPYAEGLAAERALFLTLRSSPEARALRRLFLAERESGRLPGLEGVEPQVIRTIGVVGAGLMGCGIAFAALNAGYSVIVAESNQSALEAGRERMNSLMDAAVRSGRLPLERRAGQEEALVLSTEFASFAAADLVIEAVFEDMEVKHQVFARLDSVVRPDCLLASNTSYLDLDVIAAGTHDPSRFLGMHFFSPAHVMRLLEVVRGAGTSPRALATGLAVGRKLGKIPVVTGVCDGFCGNRILRAYRTVAETMVEDGASADQIDRVMMSFGFPMGPFAVQDMAGLEIAYANRKLKPALRADGRPLEIVERLVEAGRLGRKNGKGWYAYQEGGRGGTTDPDVAAIIGEARKAKGIMARAFADSEIEKALLDAMWREGKAILDEGIVAKAEDIDLVMVNGYGYPAHKGGPMFRGNA